MCRPLRYLAIGGFGLFVIGCSEKADGPPTGPEFHTVVNTSSGCDVGHISQLANFFFKQPRQGVVKNLVDQLGTQTVYSVDAKNTGFNIMAQVEGGLNDATSGDPAVGSDLLNHLLLCMYNPASTELANYPETFPEDFTVSLTQTASAHGAFGERSGTSVTSVSPVLSRPTSAPYTGVAPPTGSTTWGSLITSNPHRVVFYGRPVLSDLTKQTYEWKSIPHNVGLNPYVIIGFCVDQATNPTTMVLEQSTGNTVVQAFADAYFLNPAAAGTCSPNLALLDRTDPFQLAHRLLRFGTDLVAPSPLMAAVLSPGGVGSKTKCCSKFNPTNVPGVSLTVTPNVGGAPSIPTPLKVNTGRFALTATTKSGNIPANGARITLTTGNNNGTPTTVLMAANPTSPCSTGKPAVGVTGEDGNSAGTYAFTNLCITSTGGVFVTVTADVDGRGDQPVSLISNKVKVIP
jgi:hypothetical protein